MLFLALALGLAAVLTFVLVDCEASAFRLDLLGIQIIFCFQSQHMRILYPNLLEFFNVKCDIAVVESFSHYLHVCVIDMYQ